MQLDIDMSGFEQDIKGKTPGEIRKLIKDAMEEVATSWEAEAKRIISDGSLDTGEFVNSVHFEMFEDGDEIGFVGMDAVNYGIYHEYGTVKHWLPFYYYGDTSKPVLADWGHRVLGLSEEEMLKMGGIMVEIKELKPFMRAMLHAQSEAAEIFKETFTEV